MRFFKLGILNCPAENESSSFVSKMTETYTFSFDLVCKRSRLFLKELMLKSAETIRFKFLVSLRLSKLISSALSSECSEKYSTWFFQEQFKLVQFPQKLVLKYFKKLFAEIELPFYLNRIFSDSIVYLLGRTCQ